MPLHRAAFPFSRRIVCTPPLPRVLLSGADGRTLLRGYVMFDPLLPLGPVQVGNPQGVAHLPVYLQVWDHADEYSMSAAADHSFRLRRDAPRRRLALHGSPCLERQSVSGPVYECKQPWQGGRVNNETGMIGMLEFRVDLGRLGQDLVGAAQKRGASVSTEERVPGGAIGLPQQIGAWLSFDDWSRGVDVSELLMDPELADEGAIAEDRGGWTWGVGEGGPRGGADRSTSTPQSLGSADNATAGLVPRGAYVPRADDPRMALLKAEQALLVHPVRPPPLKRFVQVWKRLLSETPYLGRTISRIAEHFLRTGGSGIAAYVPSSIGKHLLSDPNTLPLVERGLLKFVRWDDVMHPYSWYDYDQLFMSTHAALSHWGRNAVVFLSDMDEMLALPSHEGPTHDWEGGQVPGAGKKREGEKGDAAAELGKAKDARAQGRKGIKGRQLKPTDGRKSRPRGSAAGTDAPKGAAARGLGKGRGSPTSLDELLAHLSKEGFYSRAGKTSLMDLVEDGRPLQSPGDVLPPLAPRQRRLGSIFGAGGCLHRTMQGRLRSGRNPVADDSAVPRCGSVSGYVIMLNETAEAAAANNPSSTDAASANAAKNDGQRLAEAPTAYDALRLPFWAPRGYGWSKPSVDPDGVSSIGVHGVTMCTGPRTQAWGRPPPGGVGIPLPLRRLPGGKWNLTDVEIPMELSNDEQEPPAVDSPCKFMTSCIKIPEVCLQQRHLGNFHVKRTERWEKRVNKAWEPASEDWLWVWGDDDLSRASI